MPKFNEKIKLLADKKIAFLGFGIENQALVKFILAEKLPAAMTICDARGQNAFGKKYRALAKRGITWKLGEEANKDLTASIFYSVHRAGRSSIRK